MKKPEVGQTVYQIAINRRARGGNAELRPVTVSKVGRKYFTIGEAHRAEQYYLDNWYQNAGEYIPNYRCYESIESYENEKELERKAEFVKELFSFGWRNKISETSLCAIYDILATEGESQ